MRFKFIEENRLSLPTERLCQIMNVSSRGYRAYRTRPINQRQREDMRSNAREGAGIHTKAYLGIVCLLFP